jgi:hypothetical protein
MFCALLSLGIAIPRRAPYGARANSSISQFYQRRSVAVFKNSLRFVVLSNKIQLGSGFGDGSASANDLVVAEGCCSRTKCQVFSRIWRVNLFPLRQPGAPVITFDIICHLLGVVTNHAIHFGLEAHLFRSTFR